MTDAQIAAILTAISAFLLGIAAGINIPAAPPHHRHTRPRRVNKP